MVFVIPHYKVEMPGMRGMSITSGQGFGLPTNSAMMFFALALFVTHTLLRNAGTGYVKLVHFMTRFITTLKDEERVDIELGLAKEVGWDSYSHDVLDPLTKKSVKHDDDEESGGMYRLDTRTNLFEQVKSKVTGGEYAVCALICYIRVLYCMRTSFSCNQDERERERVCV